jgi:hypothetical protein
MTGPVTGADAQLADTEPVLRDEPVLDVARAIATAAAPDG